MCPLLGFMATIKEALKYPFANWKRMFNYWWMLIPIWGWFVVAGYLVRVINEIIKKGSKNELPAIRPWEGLFKTGFLAIITLVILSLFVFVLMLIPYVGVVAYIYISLILPVLWIQFAETKRIRDGLDVLRASNTIFTHLGKYVLALLKSFVVAIIYLLASIPIITFVVTVPVYYFSFLYLFVDFYREAKSTHPTDVMAKATAARKKKKK